MKTILLGERYRSLLEVPLQSRGYRVYWLPDDPDVDPRLAGHADLMLFCGNDTAVAAEHLMKSQKLVNLLSNQFEHIAVAKKQTAMYPGDAGLCACRVGDRLIHNPKITDPAIQALNFRTISVKQGYAACMVCTVNETSIMTADHGIAIAAQEAGLRTLEIGIGGFLLPGYREGFIGGSSFRDQKTVYFTGTLDLHPDRQRILDFIASCGCTAEFLTDLPAFDIGGAIVL